MLHCVTTLQQEANNRNQKHLGFALLIVESCCTKHVSMRYQHLTVPSESRAQA